MLVPLCGAAAGTQPTEFAGLKVTVLLFSGRPDPSYIIDDAASIDRVKKMLEVAKEAKFEKPTVTPSILGYKGIVVENARNVPGIPSRIAVYNGTIETGLERKKFLADESKTLENYLLDKAIESKVIDEKIVKRMKSEEDMRKDTH